MESFKRDESIPLGGDFLVGDKASMLGLLLTNHLFKAVQPGAHVLFVGDESGNIFRVGDKVMQTRNKYDKNAYSGDPARHNVAAQPALYCGHPRARLCVLAGSRRAISMAVGKDKTRQRFTALAWRLGDRSV